MDYKSIPYHFIALSAVPIFYLIYFRHFFSYYRQKHEIPAYGKHIEAFLYGIFQALVIILFAPYIDILISNDNVLTNAFVKAALIEKAGTVALFLLLIRYYPRFSILEGIVSGIAIGAGFSLVENITYALNFGPQVIIVRLLFSAPLHITTCGMVGYYSSSMRLSSSVQFKAQKLILACLLPTFFHGFFDMMLLMDGNLLYMAGPLIVILVLLLEILISRSKLLPSSISLEDDHLRFEDWLIKYRQPRFERWILNSTGTPSNVNVPLLRVHASPLLWIIAFIILACSAAALPFSDNVCVMLGLPFNHQTSILVTSAYPASIGLSIILVGILNPDFFRYNIVSIPIIFDTVLHQNNFEDILPTFDITGVNSFLRTFEPMEEVEVELHFEMRNFRSPLVRARPVWDHHGSNNIDEPVGTIIAIIRPGPSFYLFLGRYFIYRFWKGIVFNLKLPGFEAIRKLFMRPSTVMQKEIVYHPGATVFRQGDSKKSFYYIKKGKVNIVKKLESGESIILETMESGRILNEMAILGDSKRSVSAECVTRCVLAEAQSDNLEALIKNDPHFALALIRDLLKRVDRTQEQLTSTIEYLQKMLIMKEKHMLQSAMILSILAGGRSDQGLITLQIPAELTGVLAAIHHADLVRYIRDSLSLDGKPHPDERLDDDIEKILKGLRLDVR
ncbi:MAG TPA: cyclic nucleotide-binding domain-containing protein [Spirochaetota bacterium]|nr:cyclic nucleotide-binding domain-containing protein [Spirochaetota bacterium]HPV42994.1 cyclic nucleotide-binding domain-containing protein [Spirochaetota bacterium]